MPASESSSIGLRPIRSDTRPQTGENTKLAAANAATNPVAVAEETWKRRA